MHNPLEHYDLIWICKEFLYRKTKFPKILLWRAAKRSNRYSTNRFFYSVLLGLDGESSIGDTQQTYKIYDKEGYLISDCGELKASVYEYFHGGKYEGTTFAPDFESN